MSNIKVELRWTEIKGAAGWWLSEVRGEREIILPYGFGEDISWAERVIVDGEGYRRAVIVRVDIWRIWKHRGGRVPLPPDAQVLGYWLDISGACYCIMVTSIWAPAWAPGAHAWEVRPMFGDEGKVVWWEDAPDGWESGWFEKERKEEGK